MEPTTHDELIDTMCKMQVSLENYIEDMLKEYTDDKKTVSFSTANCLIAVLVEIIANAVDNVPELSPTAQALVGDLVKRWENHGSESIA